jgi:hypothetical protein
MPPLLRLENTANPHEAALLFLLSVVKGRRKKNLQRIHRGSSRDIAHRSIARALIFEIRFPYLKISTLSLISNLMFKQKKYL